MGRRAVPRTEHGAPWAAYNQWGRCGHFLYWLNGPLQRGSGGSFLSADNWSHGPSLPQDLLRIPGALGGIVTDCCACRKKGPASGHSFLFTDGLTRVCIHIDQGAPTSLRQSAHRRRRSTISCQGDMDHSPWVSAMQILGNYSQSFQAHDAWIPDAQLGPCILWTYCDFHDDLISISQAWRCWQPGNMPEMPLAA